MAVGGGDVAPGPDTFTSGYEALERKLQVANELVGSDLGSQVLTLHFGQMLVDMADVIFRDMEEGSTMPLAEYLRRFITMSAPGYSLEECAIVRNMAFAYLRALQQPQAMPAAQGTSPGPLLLIPGRDFPTHYGMSNSESQGPSEAGKD